MKNIAKLLTLVFIAGVFNACSSDDDPDYTYRALASLVGLYDKDYSTRTITVSDAPVASEKDKPYDVYVKKRGEGNVTELDAFLGFMSPQDALDETVVFSRFISKDNGETVTFNVSSLRVTKILKGDDLPYFFQSVMGENLKITEVRNINMSCPNGGLYLAGSNKITFKYTGTFDATSEQGAVLTKVPISISYVLKR